MSTPFKILDSLWIGFAAAIAYVLAFCRCECLAAYIFDAIEERKREEEL